MKRINLLGHNIDSLTTEEVLFEIDKFVEDRNSHYIVTPNVDILIKMNKDKKLGEICDNAGCKDPIVLHLSRHLVTIKRGGEGHYKVFDTWNSSHYSKVGYYYVSTHDEKKLLRLLP